MPYQAQIDGEYDNDAFLRQAGEHASVSDRTTISSGDERAMAAIDAMNKERTK